MKTNRIIGNVLEFLLLCGTVFLLLWILSKNIASHDYGVLGILLIAYGITFLINLILQTALLQNSEKIERSYFFAKTKLFAILLALPVVLGTLITTLIWGGFDAFFIFLVFSVAVFIPYICIVYLLFLFDKFLKRYRIWVSHKGNRTIQNAIIGIIFIGIVICAVTIILNKREENYWKNCHTSNTIEAYDTYIQKHSKGKNLEEALFRKSLLSKSQDDVDLYFAAYPSGKYKKPLEIMLKSESGKFIDERSGKEYAWVKIGEQIWMAENLNYETPESRCCDFLKGSRYDKEQFNCEEYCEKYGRLYLWNEAQCACPEGWELPSNDDWETLVKYTEWVVNGDDRNYLLLQIKNEWKHLEGNNATGFSAIPTENFISDFVDDDYSTTWWTSSEREAEHYRIWVWTIGEIFFIRSADIKTAFHSIRCIKKDDRE